MEDTSGTLALAGATKIADALDVSLDYLVGNTDTALEKDLLKKITDIQKLPLDKKNVVMTLIDTFVIKKTATWTVIFLYSLHFIFGIS
jgi:hypothetical protein